MYFCNVCKKEVVFYGVSRGADDEEDLRELRKRIEDEGKLIIFNPPPIHVVGKYHCMVCGTELVEKKD